MNVVNVTINAAVAGKNQTTSVRTAIIYARNVHLKKFVRTVEKYVLTVLLLSVRPVA